MIEQRKYKRERKPKKYYNDDSKYNNIENNQDRNRKPAEK